MNGTSPAQLRTLLTLAGSIPFIACACLLALGQHSIAVLGDVDNILSVYALVIVSFMAGSHWGQHLTVKGTWSTRLPLFSNLIAVTLWISFLILPFQQLLIAYAISFVLLLWIDKKLHEVRLIDPGYFRIRLIVTMIVITTLIISGVVI